MHFLGRFEQESGFSKIEFHEIYEETGVGSTLLKKYAQCQIKSRNPKCHAGIPTRNPPESRTPGPESRPGIPTQEPESRSDSQNPEAAFQTTCFLKPQPNILESKARERALCRKKENVDMVGKLTLLWQNHGWKANGQKAKTCSTRDYSCDGVPNGAQRKPQKVVKGQAKDFKVEDFFPPIGTCE